MTRDTNQGNAARRTAALIGLCAVVLLAGGIYVSGCINTDVGTDLGLVEPGCRDPSACWIVGVDCACTRASVYGAPSVPPACRTCNPVNDPGCVCNGFEGGVAGECLEPDEVCVGRARTTCDGVGARCLGVVPGAAPPTCAMSGGDPPNRVGTGVGGTIEQRCAFVDDVCCPGVITPDGSATLPDSSSAPTDASEVD